MKSGPPTIADADLEARALKRVGTCLLDKWRLDAVLGVGGMATVFAATHRNGKQVAIKLLHAELGGYAEVRQRFLAEGYAANRVGHPGAVSVLDDAVAEDGSNFLVMELLHGETLDLCVNRREPLPPFEALEIGDRLLDVLAAAHEQGIVHRDVKPENVFITTSGEVKLLDFGIATVVDGTRPRTTRAGTPMGTPSYMPPEQARARWEQVDARTDIWAVGATLYFALSGRNVHEADVAAEELLKAMTEQAPSLKAVAPLVPQIVAAVIDRALAFNREDRWPDARTMQAALREARALLSAPELEPAPPAETRTPPARPASEPPSNTLSARPVSYTEPPQGIRRLSARPTPARARRRRVLAAAVVGLGAAFVASFAAFRSAPNRLGGASPPHDSGPTAFVGTARAVHPAAIAARSVPASSGGHITPAPDPSSARAALPDRIAPRGAAARSAPRRAVPPVSGSAQGPRRAKGDTPAPPAPAGPADPLSRRK